MSPLRLGISLLLFAGGCASDSPVGPAEVVVLDYEFDLDLETREAAARLTLEVTEPGDCVGLPFRARDPAEASFDGESIASGELAGGVLTVCGRGWEEGEETVFSVRMTFPEETWGPSQVGYSVTEDLEGAPFHYLVSWVGGCDRFGPCDSRPERFARYRFHVTHPAGTRVLCPGEIDPGEVSTTCRFDMPGGPTYSTFGLMASPSFTEVSLGDWGGVEVTLYDMPSVALAERLNVDDHAAFLAWMVERFGPYPYGAELRFAVGPTYWNGFEHPGNIALADTLGTAPSAYSDGLAHTVRHELAHLWAGDQTTLASTYDFVWKEAMAEYLTFVFEDEVLDASVALATARAWRTFSRFAEYHPVPMERPPLLDYYGDVYGPGPMVLFRQVEALFGRAPVMAALADLLGAERAIAVADVQAALEAATGADLAGYFDAWVYGEGAPAWPAFEVAIAQEDAGPATVTVRQAQPEGRLFGCAFEVRLTGGPDERLDLWFDLGADGAPEASQVVEPGFEVTGFVFDPGAHTLARGITATARELSRPELSPPDLRIEDAPWLRQPWVAPRGPARPPTD
jgi:aminopeptidase N